MSRHRLAWIAFIVLGLIACAAQRLTAAPAASEVPTFKLRARVVSQAAEKPKETQGFTYRFSVASEPVKSTGDGWSDWLTFGQAQVEATLKGYPAIYMKGWPVVIHLSVSGVVDPTIVEAELRFDGVDQVVAMSGELYGPSLGILIWRDLLRAPHAATMAEYDQRYWSALASVDIPESQRPKRFPIVDRYIGGDNDRRAWRTGIEQLNRAGFTGIMLPPQAKIRQMLLDVGERRTAWAVYNPPGYAFDFDAKITPESIAAWAAQQAKPYLDAGYDARDMAIFAMSDEPGWYYPKAFDALTANPAAMARFHDYIKAQGLAPADLGAASWDDVKPLGRSKAVDLPSRRLFYWTMRFFAHDSARHFAVCTRALEEAFYPNVPVFTNWNFFSGRLYVPGPVANNSEKQNPDAAMGGHDWFEFGRLRGGTMLWTEDWFSDREAYQWSFYCSKLRCAAARSDVQFGGYVIPRTAGDREDGILQKILCVVGSGGKAVKYFVFGPEYNFPGNCYSENARVLPKMAEAHGMIGAAEDLLWPGKRPRAQIAILAPRSAEMWDAADIATPNQVQDATNNHLNRSTVDYMAEVFDLYLALQHANLPVDFVDEDDLTAEGLAPYRVVYVTEPNVPVDGQRGLAEWTRAGGTLVTVTGAAQRDRYNEPSTVLRDAIGVKDAPRDRLLVKSTNQLPKVAEGKGELGAFTAIGVIGAHKDLVDAAGSVEATFDDGSPAIVQRTVGKGRAFHFAWLPGLSYWKSSTGASDGLPIGFSESIRAYIVRPTTLAHVEPPVKVDQPMVETPMLVSDGGAAITLLNWRGQPVEALQVTVRASFPVQQVISVKRGAVVFKQAGDEVTLTLPLGAADVLMLRRGK